MSLKEKLLDEQDKLARIIGAIQPRLECAPEGTLRLSKSNNYIQYYHCTEENKIGKYISKGREEMARQLAQKSYDQKVLRLAEKRINQIHRILKDYEDDEIERIFHKEHVERQCLIQPVEPIWEQKVKEWKKAEYQGKGFRQDSPMILTERGERVRSKTEKIMADFFFRNGIEYKYECPIYLKGLGTVYPDFTFLCKKNGTEIYWEHNGMMDDAVYASNMVRKIQAYENNGIFVGEKLILTYETEKDILSTQKIAQLAGRYLC